jgi:predicted RNA methylase
MRGLLAHPELGERAERALLSAGLPAATYAAEMLERAEHVPEPALVRLVGRALRTHDEPRLLQALLRALDSPHEEVRRQAAISLGKSGRSAAEPALLERLGTSDPKLLRSLIEALGKVGGQAALEQLSALPTPDALRPVVERAKLMLERTTGRASSVAQPIVLDRGLPQSCHIVLGCRAGLSRLLADEAATLGARVVNDAEVSFTHTGSLRPLLELRLASSIAIAWPLASTEPSGIVAALLSPDLLATLRAWTDGPLRFRLEWQSGGHRRADTFRIAQGLREARSELVNDPTLAPWLIAVETSPSPRLLLKPTAAPDERFDYRVRDVPAASHPTLAAALARVAGVRPDDVVWDPFAGSGAELIERARLGAARELHGTDLDARALLAAKQNVARAQVTGVTLQQADARNHRISGLTLVLTNPPMGRRVLRARGLSGVLCQVVRNVASQLARQGRMVWLSPFPDATARAAADAGLQVERLGPVDLGGFSAELQRFTAR